MRRHLPLPCQNTLNPLADVWPTIHISKFPALSGQTTQVLSSPASTLLSSLKGYLIDGASWARVSSPLVYVFEMQLACVKRLLLNRTEVVMVQQNKSQVPCGSLVSYQELLLSFEMSVTCLCFFKCTQVHSELTVKQRVQSFRSYKLHTAKYFRVFSFVFSSHNTGKSIKNTSNNL